MIFQEHSGVAIEVHLFLSGLIHGEEERGEGLAVPLGRQVEILVVGGVYPAAAHCH